MGGRGEWDQKGMCGKNIQSATLEGCYLVTGVEMGASDSKRRFIPVEDSTSWTADTDTVPSLMISLIRNFFRVVGLVLVHFYGSLISARAKNCTAPRELKN